MAAWDGLGEFGRLLFETPCGRGGGPITEDVLLDCPGLVCCELARPLP